MVSTLFKDSTFESLLEIVRSRPGLYLGRKSLSALWSLLLGYEMAVIEHNIPESEQFNRKLEKDFNNWLRKKYSMGSAICWYIFVINETKSEAKAFDKLFEFWDEFRQENTSV
jgi:hypothetical protein